MDYGDIPKYLTTLKNESGELVYRGGNILNYLISVNLLNDILLDDTKYNELINEFHISNKNIPCVQLEKGLNTIKQCSISGIKFELFFNSIFKFSDSKGLLLLEVNRNEEFAPLKNGEDSENDNPRTARNLMENVFLNWFINSGGEVEYVHENIKNVKLEISYLLSYDGENITLGDNIPKQIRNDEVYYFERKI